MTDLALDVGVEAMLGIIALENKDPKKMLEIEIQMRLRVSGFDAEMKKKIRAIGQRLIDVVKAADNDAKKS